MVFIAPELTLAASRPSGTHTLCAKETNVREEKRVVCGTATVQGSFGEGGMRGAPDSHLDGRI